MKRKIFTMVFLLSLLPLHAKVSNQKSEELHKQFEQNVFGMGEVTMPVLMSGPCYQNDQWGISSGINYSIILLYPYDGELFLYGRMGHYFTDVSYQESYQNLSVSDAMIKFMNLSNHPMNNPDKVVGKIVEGESHIQWINKVTAFSIVQKNAEQFIMAYSTDNLSYSISFCELNLHQL